MTVCILCEKPSVAASVAAVLGAKERHDGYLSGNGYLVTWAFGHLVQLAMPNAYGYTGFRRENLPILPQAFKYIPRQIREDKEYRPDPGVLKQLRIIRELFSRADRLVNFGDAGREGELIFRLIYNYTGCRKPFDRLWISSLTDRAIREGLDNLRPGNDYDNLYRAAEARAIADWEIGLNATQALSIAAGQGIYSLGRVQTPVLAAISRRYRERENHISSDSWPIYISLQKDGILFKMRRTQDLPDKESATMFFQDCKLAHQAQITGISHSVKEILPPDLLDLTQLQKEANIRYGFTASEVYDIAQSLYEKKLISYPRTSSRYLTEDVFDSLSPIMARLLSWELFPAAKGTGGIDISSLSRHVINAEKANVHHAIIITGIRPGNMSEKEMQVYRLVAGRMLETFMAPCRIETTNVEAVCAAQHFKAEQTRIIEAGWHDVFMRSDMVPKSGYSVNELPEVEKSDTLNVCGCNMVHKKELPVDPFTDAELVEYMEQNGLGTVSSRTNIIRTLVNRKYIRYSGKYIVPTPKGMFTYETIRGKKIADTSLTADWEKQLAGLESGMITGQDFLNRIRTLAKEMTDDIFNTYSTKEE